MTGPVLHRERLAWDAARTFVRALESDQVAGWLHNRLAHEFGSAVGLALSESRARLWASSRLDAPQLEAGIWRARIDDLLATDGSLAMSLRELLAEASAQLDRASDVRTFVPAPELDESRSYEADGTPIIDLDRHRS